MKNYELLSLISSKIDEKQLPLIGEKIEGIIKDLKGNLINKENLGKKEIAYPIKHENKGYFLAFRFTLEPKEVKKLEEKLKNISEILRFQIIKKI